MSNTMWFWGQTGLSLDLSRVEATNWFHDESGERVLVVYFAGAPGGFQLPLQAVEQFLLALSAARRWVPPERGDFEFTEQIRREDLPPMPGRRQDTRTMVSGRYLQVMK